MARSRLGRIRQYLKSEYQSDEQLFKADHPNDYEYLLQERSRKNEARKNLRRASHKYVVGAPTIPAIYLHKVLHTVYNGSLDAFETADSTNL